jgi:UDP-glucose 4-epimerase
MKLAVTGATGHLGKWVVHLLAKHGYEVIALSRSGKRPAPPFGETPCPQDAVHGVVLDIASEGAVEILARHLGRDVVLIHLAAWHPPSTASTTAQDLRGLIEVNVLGTLRVLDAARQAHAGAAAVVYASTFEVYGEPHGAPITEDHPTRPITDYGATKLAGEDHVVVFGQEERCRTVALRMPAIYGPEEETTRALPLMLDAAARGEAPTIFGDGEDLRDQLYVSDAAAVVQAACGAASGIFNVADGEPHSIRAIARCAMDLAGVAGTPRTMPRAKPRRDYHMSIDRCRGELPFTPQVRLRDGMHKQLEWLRSRPRSS